MNILLQSKVVIGNPDDEKVDLIIMGTTGLAGVSRVKAIGSVAKKVSEHSPCPIMLIH